MALTKDQKQDVIDKISSLLQSSKMTVVATYQGTSVKQMQQLRRDAKPNGTTIQVLKNRLVHKAIASNDTLKDVSTDELKGQLLYAFNSDDEVAPAQALATFAKANPTIQFVGAISEDGKFLSADEVKALASLPSKPQLIAEVVAMLSSPLNDVVSGLSGNLHALLDGIEAKATN
ncbi:50S ribosomal protein L10 [Candidatus Saccharibacteria bacterium]|nr:50S ribosomal protein L10 [Candidatus Saccharibacteria bacterium]MCA9337781.1 50S ribosomal protein L10 [Candidatus Saccharibacteria bacterium]